MCGSCDASRTNANPHSYGTFSHLWPSAITESARSIPCARCAACGVVRAKRPKAPSTWSHAPYVYARSASSSIGSKSPAFTSPALPIRIAGAPPSSSSARSSASTSRRPASSRANVVTLFAAHPQHPEGLDRGRVDVAAREDGDGREPGQPVGVHVDAVPAAPPAPRGGERGEVRHRRARRQNAAPLGRELEEVEQPGDRRALELRAERRLDPRERVLVEHRRDPVGAERGGRHAAGDEVEVPRPRRRDRGVEPLAEQPLEHREAAVALLGERRVEPPRRLLDLRPVERCVVESREVRAGPLGDERQRRLDLRALHGAQTKRAEARL